MENFCSKFIWYWLFSPGFRVNKLVMNNVFFHEIAFKITQFIYFFEIPVNLSIAITMRPLFSHKFNK